MTSIGGDPAALAFVHWLALCLIPFSVFGLALARAGMRFDNRYTAVARRWLGGLMTAIVLSAAVAFAVVIPDLCDQYVGTAWWYLWGCWMYAVAVKLALLGGVTGLAVGVRRAVAR